MTEGQGVSEDGRPAPVRDLAWGAAEARSLGGELLELWAELLDRLPELPVGG
ncbi:MAG: hypothetical protein GWM90_17380, partial [Gemmatimonadetes bacterium]|nr:hypothetical protein [Gemmatimonadota bacterium]NIQ56110.1 hypothetical protein [Gemmatimonadota bacterium]NIU76294.1 hypothetical protein [Gammaproteobacteria bacterium]NIX45798.1 hypothetical protein [Gemmatimonadota bacterium]NIY10120.1 hypothetical protein [Gemmatimonadota bacterium]